jgi:hypothetical protein
MSAPSSLSSPATTSQIPALAPSDITDAISLIQAAYAPIAASDFPALQSALLAMQCTPAAWGLIVPLLAHADRNVQFFGAHTVHYAKISRGKMAVLPHEEQAALCQKSACLTLLRFPSSRRHLPIYWYPAAVSSSNEALPKIQQTHQDIATVCTLVDRILYGCPPTARFSGHC